MFRIDDQILKDAAQADAENCQTCFELVNRFGELARTMMTPRALHNAGLFYSETLLNPQEAIRLSQPLPLPAKCGSCSVLCAMNAENINSPLSPGIALPLRWQRSDEQTERLSRLLPDRLVSISSEVLEKMYTCSTDLSESPEDWCLTLGVDYPEAYDLSGLEDCEFASSWAALAAAWILAIRGGTPDRTVGISAAWNEQQGFIEVGGLKEKALAATRAGIRTLYVAPGQVPTGHKTLGIELIELPAQFINPYLSLKPVLRRMFVVPDREASLTDHSYYYWFLKKTLSDDESADTYYRTCMLSQIVNECRDQLKLNTVGNFRLITVASRNEELAELIVRILLPNECLLLSSRETRSSAEKLRRIIEEDIPDCHRVIIHEIDSTPDHPQQYVNAQQVLQDYCHDEEVIIDLTTGTKSITVGLTHFAMIHNCRSFLLQCEYDHDQIIHGTEKGVLLPANKIDWSNS
ncbi:hypothetical protein [Rubinisphaera italica]|uniref:CRISPR-associated protein n=1 Tax=Rubinisphaera italica TaxID=2527969 RepID=A0A5C5XLJ6_9PLAN|nr:hypothetical protein [Rubinisphaera italica]TWT63734.1 CRISPR-associated protein [Rubinisphaera italica]